MNYLIHTTKRAVLRLVLHLAARPDTVAFTCSQCAERVTVPAFELSGLIEEATGAIVCAQCRESDRIAKIWGCAFYATGETDESGDPKFQMGLPPTKAAWWYAFEKHLMGLWFDTKNPQLTPLVEIARARGAFHLSAPMTYLLWLDFLGKFPERGEAWEAFEREHGAIEMLTFYNG